MMVFRLGRTRQLFSLRLDQYPDRGLLQARRDQDRIASDAEPNLLPLRPWRGLGQASDPRPERLDLAFDPFAVAASGRITHDLALETYRRREVLP